MALFKQTLAVDIGSTNTVIAAEGRGIVYCEPTVVAVDARDRRILASGQEAREMLGRTPGTIIARHPIERGSVMDSDMAAAVLTDAVNSVWPPALFRPAAAGVVVISPGAGDVEQRVYEDMATAAGLRELVFVHSPLAAAWGMELCPDEACGRLVAILGAGRSELAVISLSGIVSRLTLPMGGADIDAGIREYVRRTCAMEISDTLSELIKASLARVGADADEHMYIRGRDLETGLPRERRITSGEVRLPAEQYAAGINDGICRLLADTPPELVGDVQLKGMFVCGGASGLAGLAQSIGETTGLAVHISGAPMSCTTVGALKMRARARRLSA